MARTHKAYQELTFTDDYMFCKILENDTDLCRRLVSLILEKYVKKVELVDVQHTITVTSDIRSIRFDVYLNDTEGTVFDLEMQTANQGNIPKRSRYYQSITDIDHLAAGHEYEELPQSYIIFICTFDPFDMGLPKYEFRNICVEDTLIELNDQTSKVFINAKSDSEDISNELRALLDYLCGKKPLSKLTKDIDDRIADAKNNRRWESDYVLFEDMLKEEHKAGHKAGREEILQMTDYLIKQERYEDLKRAIDDPDYREQILAEIKAEKAD